MAGELTLTKTRRRVLEVVASHDPQAIRLDGTDVAAVRWLEGKGLLAAAYPHVPGGARAPVAALANVTEAGEAWLKAHPRRGRRFAGSGGLSERVDVRITAATAAHLDAKAEARGVTRNEVAREILDFVADPEHQIHVGGVDQPTVTITIADALEAELEANR